MFRRVLLAAVLAGIAAGACLTLVQYFRLMPLILAAEAFEKAPSTPKSGDGHEHHAPKPDIPAADTAEEAKDRPPRAGVERTAFTLLTNVLVGVAFALLLAGAMTLTGRPPRLGIGVVWGLAGYLVFAIAPALGLPPELPGVPAAELTARQIWWCSTVASTAGGIALVVFGKQAALKGIGIVLIVGPHIVGAPHAASHDSAVPAGLAAQFAAASLAVAALFWIVLGAATGWLLARGAKD
jgi:cobalt transporter subunit CbtA